jgi:predicted dinucleotide-binding enzyme
MPERIAIVGAGRAGTALLEGFRHAGWPAEVAPKEPAAARALVAKSALVVLAVPYGARHDVVRDLGAALDGKILVDVTNPLKFPGPTFDRATVESGAEELQAWAPRARVVKAFNTVFSRAMPTGRVGAERTSAFAAADDADAKRVVLALAKDMGFDAVDAGPLANADGLERLLFFEMLLERVHGSDIGLRLLRTEPSR